MKERSRPVSPVAQPVRSFFQRFSYVGLAGAAFALMLLGKAETVLVDRIRAQAVDAVAPILDVLSRPLGAVARVTDRINEVVALRDENERLREEKARLMQWQAAARRLEAENRSLQELLKYVPEPGATYITARVIGDSKGAFVNLLVINAGERHGVRKGQAAVTGEGLVGRVTAVGTNSALVLLVTDLNSHIPVLVESTRTRAILAGNNTQTPLLVHLPPGSTVTAGDRVVTSGHGDVFPPGLPIGIVSAVTEKEIRVQPLVDRDRLEFVRLVDFGLEGILQIPQPVPQARGKKRP